MATISPTPTHDPGLYYAADYSFTFKMPEGWETQEFSFKYLGIVGPNYDGYITNMLFLTEENDYSMVVYSAAIQNNVKLNYPDATHLSEEAFVNPGGFEYYHLVMQATVSGIPVRFTYYLMQRDEMKFVVFYGRNSQKGEKNDAAAEEVINTLKFAS